MEEKRKRGVSRYAGIRNPELSRVITCRASFLASCCSGGRRAEVSLVLPCPSGERGVQVWPVLLLSLWWTKSRSVACPCFVSLVDAEQKCGLLFFVSLVDARDIQCSGLIQSIVCPGRGHRARMGRGNRFNTTYPVKATRARAPGGSFI